MTEFHFVVPGQPQGRGRARFSMRGGFARTYTPEKTRSYEAEIKWCAIQAGAQLMEGPLKMTIDAYFQIPASWSKKRRREADEGYLPCLTRPDSDNLAKNFMDALHGISYADDKIIVELRVCKIYSEHPKVIVSLERL